MGSLEGKVAIVTGAGRSIGRAEALRLAAEGCAVVVNDVNASVAGERLAGLPAEEVAAEIRARGGRAVANGADVSSWAGGEAMVRQALEEFDRLDVLINNAGNSRPRMLFNMTEEDWDLVTTVHLKGSFVPTRWAAIHWRSECKRTGQPCDAAVVFTSSSNGLHATEGHINYNAAKAGIAAMCGVTALELAPYGVRSNCIAPLAFSRMTEELHGGPLFSEDRRVDLGPENVAEVVTWLCSPYTEGVTGQMLSFGGRRLSAMTGWQEVSAAESSGDAWSFDALNSAKDSLFPLLATGGHGAPRRRRVAG